MSKSAKPHLILRLAFVWNILANVILVLGYVFFVCIDPDSSNDYEQGRMFGNLLARLAFGVLIATGIAIVMWIRDAATNKRLAIYTIGLTLLLILIVAVAVTLEGMK